VSARPPRRARRPLVYFGTGGIQTTADLHGGFLRDEFQPVDPKTLLASEELNREAIQLAVAALREAAAATNDAR
jgi:hypothetical protein